MQSSRAPSPPVVFKVLAVVAGVWAFVAPGSAVAKGHLWRFQEIFSNADGTVQFIEMKECCGSSEEVQLYNRPLSSNANTYLFPNNLSGDTAYKTFLMATQAFADLEGAPAPDFIIPENFFDPAGDELLYRTVDTFTIPAETMPIDGVHSLERDLSTPVNSPTNFAGVSGSVDLSAPVPSASRGILLAGVLLLVAVGALALGRRPRVSRSSNT